MPEITPEHAITWMTANAARALGIEGQTGTLRRAKWPMVVWNGNPSVPTRWPSRSHRRPPPVRPQRTCGHATFRLPAWPGGALMGALNASPGMARRYGHGAGLPLASAQAQDLLVRNATVWPARAAACSTPMCWCRADHPRSRQRTVRPAGASVVEADGRPLTPALFGGITEIGVEEVSGEASTVDSTLKIGEQPLRPRVRCHPGVQPGLGADPGGTPGRHRLHRPGRPPAAASLQARVA